MPITKTFALYVLTACAEIAGCYLPYLWLRNRGTIWLLVPAALSLTVFAWLLSLHPNLAGRTYAAYGGVYVATSTAWLWIFDRKVPDRWDIVGALVAIAGMCIIAFGPHESQ
jgi:small multidrug resistance family-3 protein